MILLSEHNASGIRVNVVRVDLKSRLYQFRDVKDRDGYVRPLLSHYSLQDNDGACNNEA